MKWLLFVVLGLLTGCTTIQFDEGDMNNSPEYAKSGGWSAFKSLRNNGIDNMGLGVNFLAARDNNPIPAKGYTVQFFIGQTTNDVGSPLLALINPVAEITWSVAGNDVRRTVSVTNGASVSGVGQGVKVVVTDRTFNNGSTAAAKYDVGVTVAPGTRPSENQPATYNPTLADNNGIVLVPPASTVDVLIPQNAGVISAYITAVPTDLSAAISNEAIVQQVGALGDIVRVYDPVSSNAFVPIMAQSVKLTLINTSATKGMQFAITFGIDG